MVRHWAQSKPSEYQQNQREGGKLESHLHIIFLKKKEKKKKSVTKWIYEGIQKKKNKKPRDTIYIKFQKKKQKKKLRFTLDTER